MLAKGNGQHPESGVETEREVTGAGVTEPEMFTSAELASVAVESGAEVGRNSFRQEQLAFAKGKKGNRAGRVCAFMEHWLGPVFSLWNSIREMLAMLHARGRTVGEHTRIH